jgi:hypothetical protein
MDCDVVKRKEYNLEGILEGIWVRMWNLIEKVDAMGIF